MEIVISATDFNNAKVSKVGDKSVYLTFNVGRCSSLTITANYPYEVDELMYGVEEMKEKLEENDNERR